MFQTIGWSVVGAFVGANSGRWELKRISIMTDAVLQCICNDVRL